MSTLRRATVRPTNLYIHLISDSYLPELLKLWSNLSDLHLISTGNTYIPGPSTTAALAGSRGAAPLCPSLRYLTVHMKHGQKNPKMTNESIRRLKRMVKERRRHGVVGLQRVMCVWDWEENGKRTDVEWVDVL
jgi:hypothetical protein